MPRIDGPPEHLSGIYEIASNKKALPSRLLWHGNHFDFLAVWEGYKPSEPERQELLKLVCAEVEISRELEKIFFRQS